MKRSDPTLRAAEPRIAALISEYGLFEGILEPLISILGALAGEHAPTAVKNPLEGADVHIADSLSGLETIREGNHSVIADIGSGCGIPGLVLAAALPDSEVIAVESQGRKCDFVEEAAANAGIGNIRSAWARAEEWHEGFSACDVVTARALADLPVVFEYAAPLLKQGGRVVAWKGKLEDGEIERGNRAAEALLMSSPELVTVEPWVGGGVRKLVVSRREGELPPNFPRRPGMATKRPLGS